MGNPLKKIYDKGKQYVQRGTSKGKDYVRSAAKPLAKSAPVAAGLATTALSWLASPVIGAGAGTLFTLNARNLGAVAARGEGLKGKEAREEGRDLRKKVGIASAAGVALGFTVKTVAPMLTQALAPAAPAASSASTGFGGSLSNIAGMAKGAAATTGGGLLSTATTVIGALSPLASSLLKTPAHTTVPTTDGFLGDLVAGLLGGGGAPGAGAPVEDPAGTGDAFKAPSSVPTWVKVGAGAAALVVGGLVVKKLAKKAA